MAHFKDFIPKAFKHGDDMILDGEVLMVDNNTGKPLPFGTLGKHKAAGKKRIDSSLFCGNYSEGFRALMFFSGSEICQIFVTF